MAGLTVGGLRPSNENETYKFTVNDIKDCLQKKLNLLITANNRKCDQDEQYAQRFGRLPENITITLSGVQCGDTFTVLTLMLPMSVVMNKRRRNAQEECSLFNPQDQDQKRVELSPKIWSFFRGYMFTKDETSMMRTAKWQRDVGLKRTSGGDRNKMLSFLLSYASPRIIEMKGQEVVVFNLDALKVFHDLLKKDDDSRAYEIIVEDVTKIEGMNFRFSVRRKVRKGRRSHSDESDFINSLLGGRNKRNDDDE